MAKRPSLADSLMASLSKGVHVDTAEKIAKGFKSSQDSSSPHTVTNNQLTDVVTDEPSSSIAVISSKINKAPTKSIELSNGRTDGRSNKRATKQTGNQTIGGSVELTSEQVNERFIGLSVERSDDRTFELTNGLSNERVVSQSPQRLDEQTSEQSNKHLYEPSVEQSTGHSMERLGGRAGRSIWMPLTENQGKVLLYLYEEGGGLTNVDTIMEDTLIAYGTVRKCLDVLLKEGYMISKKRFNGHAFNGFTYDMNNHLCSLYVSGVRNGQSSGRSHGRSNGLLKNPSLERTDGQTHGKAIPYSSSSYFEEKPTTTKSEILKDPELRYWAEEGVTEKQIQTWMSEFQMAAEEITISLRYARFDILERGDVQNPQNWFYKLLTRTGFYPKPQNYKSLLEIRAAALHQQQEADRAAVAQIEALEREENFQKILANPDSQIYKELLSQVGSFAREQMNDGDTRAAEIEMRELFKNIK